MHNLISQRVGRVLLVIGFAFCMIVLRVWYLASPRHDEYVEKAKKPQRRTVVEHIGRASIRDRFNLPLAINKTQFNVAVCYAHLRQIPSIEWKTDPQGKRVRVPVRSKYIENLAQRLGEELEIDPQQIEDTIHAKATLMPHVPFTIAENITEQQYYRLRLMEKDWPGIVSQRASKRFYPKGKVACDVLGMMGAISAEEYLTLAEELAELEHYILLREQGENPFLPKGFSNPLEVRDRLSELRQKAYTLRDYVGKNGIEAAFDEDLRGLSGKKLFEIDVKGNVIRQLPGSFPPVSGRRLILTLSRELQEYAEELLAQAEAQRCRVEGSLTEPWIKGGAIVAMDAKTGEVLALASYPRFDPNDFIPVNRDQELRSRVLEWLENDGRIGEIWDGHASLEREHFFLKQKYHIDKQPLTWQLFLEAAIPQEGGLKRFFEKHDSLGAVFQAQEVFFADRRQGKTFDDDEFLAIDLTRLIAKTEDFPDGLKEKLLHVSCGEFFQERQAFLRLRRKIEEEARELHATKIFARWREKRFKTYLKRKRQEEKEEHRYPRPFTDYLEHVQKAMFAEFWQNYHLSLMESLLEDSEENVSLLGGIKKKVQEFKQQDPHLSRLANRLATLDRLEKRALVKSFKGFQDLNGPLLKRYPRLRKSDGQNLQKHLAAAFYPLNGYGYGRSQAFRQSTPAGSVFKMAIGYQALLERYEELKEKGESLSMLNPLTLIDESRKGTSASVILGKTLDGKTITRVYKGGRLPRSSHPGIGQIDFVGAIEQSSNVYMSILAAEEIKDPLSLTQIARFLGYGEKSGIELPGEIPGTLPKDLAEDKTALYAYAIGQHSLVVTPLQTAVMMAALAGEGNVLQPSIVQVIAGRDLEKNRQDLFERSRFEYQEDLGRVGVYFPLFTVPVSHKDHASVAYSPIQVRRSLFLPKEIRDLLLEGMKRVVNGGKGTARPAVVRPVCAAPEVHRNYVEYASQMAGKTGTAEILYKHTVDKATKATLRKHTWFAGASFVKENGIVDWDQPDIVVVVYLRFADAGREAAPLGTLIMKKWKEICAKHGETSYISPPIDDRLN